MNDELITLKHFTASLRANMDEQSAVPAVALGRQESLPKRRISEVAIEQLFLPLTQKMKRSRWRLGRVFREGNK
jgi:hypothetical protein